MQGVVVAGQRGVRPVRGEEVLRQVVRADAEELDFPGQLPGEEDRGRDLDHDPADESGRLRERLRREACLCFVAQREEQGDVLAGRDHRRHDVRLDSGQCSRPRDRPELGEQQGRGALGDPDGADAEKRVRLGRQVKVRDRLVPADVGQPDDDRPFGAERLEDRSIGLDLLLL